MWSSCRAGEGAGGPRSPHPVCFPSRPRLRCPWEPCRAPLRSGLHAAVPLEAGAPAVPLPSQPPWHRGRLLLRVIAAGSLRLPQQLRDNGGSLTRTPCPEPADSTRRGCLPPHPNPCSKQRDGGKQTHGKKRSGDTGTASPRLPHTGRKWGHCRRPALRVPLCCLCVSPRAGFRAALPAVPARRPQATYSRQAGDTPAFICRPKGPLHHCLPPSRDPI